MQIAQDLDNAQKILSKKTEKLRQRLNASSNLIRQINQAGGEMDGNTSTHDEDEFIEAL